MKRLVLVTFFNLFLIISYSQDFIWANGMGSTGNDAAYAVTTDASGNVYTTGAFTGTMDVDPGAGVFNLTSAGSSDAFISKSNSAGTLIWAKRIGGGSLEAGYAIKVDPSGNVYVGGTFATTVDFDPGVGVHNVTVMGTSDAFIVKLDAAGDFVWASIFGGTGNERVTALELDAAGVVYSTGHFHQTCDFDPGAGTANLVAGTTTLQSGVFISKLANDGSYIWAGRIGSGQFQQGTTIAVDAIGAMYIGGFFAGGTDFDPGAGFVSIPSTNGYDGFVCKLSAAGAYIFAVNYNGGASGGANDDAVYSIKLDATGNILATGTFSGTIDLNPGAATNAFATAGLRDCFISKLTSSGGYIWGGKIGGTGEDFGYGISSDAADNIYCVGHFTNTADLDPGAAVLNRLSSGGSDAFILKLNSAGSLTYAKKFGGFSTEQALAVNVNSSGNTIYTAGVYAGLCNFNSESGAYYNESNAGSQDAYMHKIGNCSLPANQTLSASQSSVCAGSSTTIGLSNSEVGSFYYLRNDLDNSILQGPIAGTGSAISFNTGILNTTTTFNVYGSSVLLPTNYALDLDGVDDYVYLGTNNRGVTNALTVSAKIRTSLTGSNQFIVSKYLGGGIGYYLLVDATGKASIQGRDIAGAIKTSGNSTTTVADNQWHDITGVVRSTGWEIWIDGVLESSGAYSLGATGLATTAGLVVGQFSPTFSPMDIDHFAIWNTALAPATIVSNVTTCLVGSEANLTGYFPFSESNGTTTIDYSVTAINGVLTNMTVPADWISGPVLNCSTGCEIEMGGLVTVTVDANPSQPTITSSGANAICAGSSVTLTASTGTTYLWSTGATTGSISPTTAGAYTVQVTNAAGCQSVASVGTNILVNTLPLDQTVTPSSVNICSGGNATINVASTEAGVNYTLVNDATNTTVLGPIQGTGSSINFNLSGITSTTTYHVTALRGNGVLDLDGTNDYVNSGTGNRGVTSTITVSAKVKTSVTGTSQFIVNKYISASIGYYLVITATGQASFQGRDISGGIKSSGNSTTMVADNQWHEITGVVRSTGWEIWVDGVLENSGAYALPGGGGLGTTAPLLVGQFNGTYSPANIDQVAIWNTSLSPAIILYNSSNCLVGNETNLVALFKFNEISGTIATDSSPTAINGTLTNMTAPACWIAGPASACLGSCEFELSQLSTVTVDPTPAQPIISADGPLALCSGGSVTLTSSTGTSYLWSNGALTPSITVSTAGTYSVQVINASGCQSVASAVTTVTVGTPPAQPTISAGGPVTFCAGGSVTLTSSAGTSYLWSNGATTAAISPTTAGTYSVQVTNAAGCQSVASAATTVTVNAAPTQPTISAGGPTTFCAGGSVTLTSTAGTSYLWSNGATTAAINATTAGPYTVQVTNASGCQSAASTVTAVTVNTLPAQPTISAGGPTTFCAGGSVTLTSSAGTSYFWSNGASTTSINPTTSGTYSLQVTNAFGCLSVASAGTVVTVNALPSQPTITAGGPTTFCAGGSVTLTASSGTSYLWMNGATTAAINATTAGIYTVQVTNAAGCQSVISAGIPVTVNALPAQPTISAGGPTTFCAGGSVTLTSTAGMSYSWSNGATTAAISPTTAGNYTVQVTNASGCQSVLSAATTIAVNALPVISLGTLTNPTSCTIDNGSIEVNGTGTGNLAWNGTSSGSLTGVTLPATIPDLSDGSFTITFTNASGCTSTPVNGSLVAPSAPAAPGITASGTTTFCAGGSVTLTSSAGSGYLWSNGETTPSIVVSAAGNYTVSITDASGCSSASSAGTAVTINALPVILSGTVTNPSSCTVDNGSIEVSGSEAGDLFWTGASGGSLMSTTLPATINNLGDGTYAITFTNALGCTSTVLTVSLSLPGTPGAPIISTSGAITFCAGGSVTLTSSSGSTYLWSNGETTPSIEVAAAGTFTVIITDSDGCTSPSSSATTVAVDEMPDLTVTVFNNVITANQAGASYQWINCGNGNQSISGATGVSYAPTANGTYAVIVSAGTCSDTSGCVALSTIGLEEKESATIDLYPNPGMDIVQVVSNGEILQIELFATTGELIRIEQQAVFDVRELSRGIYLVKVTTNKGTGMIRMVKE